ncbi:hypothetical protein [Mesorhizobium sp. WSM3626]|uniref:hypothetical protein n=1 Tax=Mesorhizobium sp. WSM3626 TaxID=1040987 RepID=UPI0004852143|nr:hypothetical protein [Mesorhizobium sp. WSM3626]
MAIDRLTVRFAYQRGFQVVDDGPTVLATFEARHDAFKFILQRGARVRLSWARTVIGGRAAPYDFAASFIGNDVGRIMKHQHGPSAGAWHWGLYYHDALLKRQNGARGRADSKDEAVAEIEREFTRFVAASDEYLADR